MDSIGEILRQQREKRGLSVQEAHDATKIAIGGIESLEHDRFETFANKVYARAFLRDYANFLGLDSAALLEAYEQKWSSSAEAELTAAKKAGGSPWRAVGYWFAVVVVVLALAAGGYYGLYTLGHKRAAGHVGIAAPNHAVKPEVATIPKAQPLAPPISRPAPKPPVAPKPEAPPVPQKLTLEVTALDLVWVRVRTDGRTAFIGNFVKGQTQTFEGKSIYIRTGKAGAVQLKLNGVLQPPLGSLRVVGDKTFTLPASPQSPSQTAPTTPPAP
jgi:transcriptional regulator with XRE-family HTH domain